MLKNDEIKETERRNGRSELKYLNNRVKCSETNEHVEIEKKL